MSTEPQPGVDPRRAQLVRQGRGRRRGCAAGAGLAPPGTGASRVSLGLSGSRRRRVAGGYAGPCLVSSSARPRPDHQKQVGRPARHRTYVRFAVKKRKTPVPTFKRVVKPETRKPAAPSARVSRDPRAAQTSSSMQAMVNIPRSPTSTTCERPKPTTPTSVASCTWRRPPEPAAVRCAAALVRRRPGGRHRGDEPQRCRGADGVIEKDTKPTRPVGCPRPDTVAVLRAHRKRVDRRAAACRATVAGQAHIFSADVEGARPWTPNEVTKRFIRLRKWVDQPAVRLHYLRHFAAARLLAAGVPVRLVSGLLGHANAASTLEVYAHFVEESDREVAATMGALVS